MLKPELKNVFLNTPLGRCLDTHEIEMLVKHNKLVTFPAGEIILQQGKKSQGMFIIIEGTALVTAKILGEGGTYITTLGYGNLIGEISLIDKGPCATSVIASSRVICLLISHAYFDMLSVLYPETKFKITNIIAKETCDRLNEMHRKIANFIKHSDMASRSMFVEVIKSITRPTTITFEEAGVDKNELQKTEIFDSFSKEEFDKLISQVALIHAPKQCVLIQQGEKDISCYILLRGAVLASVIEDNKMAKLSVFGPFSVFSSISLIDNNLESVLNFTTCEHAILLKIIKSDLANLQKINSTYWYKLFGLICKSFVMLERATDKLDIRLKSELYNR